MTEKLSGEDRITQKAVDLFYGKIDSLVEKRIEDRKMGLKNNTEDGVDILDLFLQSTTDAYTLGGMVFAFLVAGRKFQPAKDKRSRS